MSTGGGSARAELVERDAVPPPVVGRRELRWRDGRWEKLLAKGWVAAGKGKPMAASRVVTSRKSKRHLEAEIREVIEDESGGE